MQIASENVKIKFVVETFLRVRQKERQSSGMSLVLLDVWPHNSEMRKMGRKRRNLLTANLLPHTKPKTRTHTHTERERCGNV